MARALEILLRNRREDEIRQGQAVKAGFDSFIQGQQQARKNQLDLLSTRASLAKSGLQLGPNNSIIPAPELAEATGVDEGTKLTNFSLQNGKLVKLDEPVVVPKDSPLPEFKPLAEIKEKRLREQFGLEQAGELRKASGESRREDILEKDLREQGVKRINEAGVTMIDTPEGRQTFENTTGLDLQSAELAGFAKKFVDPGGETKIRYLSQSERDQVAKRKTLTPSEETFFNDLLEAGSLFTEVKSELAELGITDPREAFDIKFDEAENPFFADLGPFSLPARFNVIGQFSKDPRYTSAKRKLEQAFQKYRKIITGAQASNKELRTLRPLISAFTDTPEVFFDSLDNLVAQTQRVGEDRLNIMGAFGRSEESIQQLQSILSSKFGGAQEQTGGISDASIDALFA